MFHTLICAKQCIFLIHDCVIYILEMVDGVRVRKNQFDVNL